MESIKRSLLAHFLNTTPRGSSKNWAIVGRGVSDMSVAYNPQVRTEQDITMDTADSEVTAYQPNLPVTQSAKKGDDIFPFVDEIRRNRAVYGDAETELLEVDLYDGDESGGYAAELQKVSIQIDSFGGAAPDPVSIGYTINFKGDPVHGKFNPSTKQFTANTTMSLSTKNAVEVKGDN